MTDEQCVAILEHMIKRVTNSVSTGELVRIERENEAIKYAISKIREKRK